VSVADLDIGDGFFIDFVCRLFACAELLFAWE
jgi:hypothetical protein